MGPPLRPGGVRQEEQRQDPRVDGAGTSQAHGASQADHRVEGGATSFRSCAGIDSGPALVLRGEGVDAAGREGVKIALSHQRYEEAPLE